MVLTDERLQALRRFLNALVDQAKARVVVAPHEHEPGYWFGGGNLVAHDGYVWLCGRFRDAGDSRTGVARGPRGVSCHVFRAAAGSLDFEPVVAVHKDDLRQDAPVLSIEGTALHRRADGTWELYVSSEKEEAYPAPYEAFQKPGTGIWSIDRLNGSAPGAWDLRTLTTVLRGRAPDALHVKDPVVLSDGERLEIAFSAHPVSWASSNTGVAVRALDSDGFDVVSWQAYARGPVWDVAATRVTDRLRIPRQGAFESEPEIDVLFYDGAESMRRIEPSEQGRRRPRGWSCEEIGGAFWAPAGAWAHAQRLSSAEPWFVSPHGTGSSRYVKTLATRDGIYATWQQARDDGSQPLVMNLLSWPEVDEALRG